MVVVEKGDARVNMAVDDIRCMMALRMKWGESPGSASGSVGSESEGLWGVERLGIGKVRGNLERRIPRAGWAGMVPACVWKVIEVL